MFNRIFQSKHAIKRHIDTPLLNERLEYLQYWFDNGAKLKTLRAIAQILLSVICYLKLEEKKVITILDISKAAKKYANRPYRKKCKFSKNAEAYFNWHATQWLKMLCFLKLPEKRKNILEEELAQYVKYMREEKGLSEATIYSATRQLNDFFSHFKHKIVSTLSAKIIDNILEKKHNKDGYQRNSLQTYASILRAFLRYAEDQCWCKKGLAISIKTLRAYQYQSLPYGPSWDDINKLLAGTEGDDPTSIRDRAVLMLLAIYGLRSVEITSLCLDNFDWQNETFCLAHSKSSRLRKFPLSKIVGNAILRYIKEARNNNCLYREVFISRYAPSRPLTHSAIYAMLSSRWKLLNIKIRHYGPHSLRHACATHLVNSGISIKKISDYLGHQNIDTTGIYAKVDLINLRKVSNFNIGDLL